MEGRKVYSGANAVNEEDPERDRATPGVGVSTVVVVVVVRNNNGQRLGSDVCLVLRRMLWDTT